MMIEIIEAGQGLIFGIKAFPNAQKTEISGEHAGILKIKVNAQPEKGKANKEITEYLSEILGIRKSDIEIVSGETARNKRIMVSGITREELVTKLRPSDERRSPK